jgi:hypothetical protein
MWAFANPSEFEHLLAGIAQNRDPYKITTLGVLLNSHMGVDSIIAEEVLDVATNANDAERRAFMVRTVEGNCYLLGDEILERTTFDVIIYQSSRHNDQWPKAHL